MKKILISIILVWTIAYFCEAKKTSSSKIQLTATEMKALGFGGQKFNQIQSGVWEIKNGIKIYSSEAYGKQIWGYGGNTPIFIAVSPKGKIVSIAAAPNMETPDFFAEVLSSKLLQKWNGKTPKEASTYRPDIVSGATYSSTAIIKTVNATAKHIK